MTPFTITTPPRILFGRGEAARAPALIRTFGPNGIVVHGADARRAAWLVNALRATGANVTALSCPTEPTLTLIEAALITARSTGAHWVAALGGGAALDMGKALAALIPAPGPILDHLKVVGAGLPLRADPLPFIAMPTTAGTGAEVTRNAVIGLPDHGRKVSLRDDRMIARLAIVDPALTDGCPRAVTLASGLDALAQVIEPFVSLRANAYTDALTRPAIALALPALQVLMTGEDAQARDTMAWVSLCGGLALANAGLGAVHGLAGPIGGVSPAAHGAVCGALLGPVLAMNRARATGPAADKLAQVCATLATALDCTPADAPRALSDWVRHAGLPGLTAQGLDPGLHPTVAKASLEASSMKGNPVPLSVPDLLQLLAQAS
jgi:alcohol dehydrogenase class IV